MSRPVQAQLANRFLLRKRRRNVPSLAWIIIARAFLLSFPLMASDFSTAKGLKDACVAGALLDASHVPYAIVIFGHGQEEEAACRYEINGSDYLYTLDGSAKIDTAQLNKVVTGKIPRQEMLRISDGDRELPNGCLVLATCAFARDQKDTHVVWAGLIAAQIVDIENVSAGGADYGLTGHAITAFENDKHEIFIQPNGDEPEKIDEMTELAQKGDKSWHDPSVLIFCDHHCQALTSFLEQSGRPR